MHPPGAHALLADGRTAALVDPDGDVAWLCWPRIDSTPCLLGILDDRLGGSFRVAPDGAGAVLVDRAYLPGTLVLRTTWRAGEARLEVDDALAWEGRPALVRVLRACGSAVTARVTWRPALDAGRTRTCLSTVGRRAVAGGGGARIAVDVTGTEHGWVVDGDTATATLSVHPGASVAVVLGDAATPPPSPSEAEARLAATTAHWRDLDARIHVDIDARGVAARALGPSTTERLLRLSGRVMVGLTQRGGGPVAAPTTSIPQWPGSSRTWDYRYAWPRDTALAALALLRLGLVEEAASLGGFCGEACASGEPPALLRVDGSAPPPETELDHLAGHGGARPVRIGNAAAGQAQLDVVGEVVDLAHALHRHDALPRALAAAVPRLAGTALERSWVPDHGIWEVRGRPRVYTQSRVMAWTALRRAATLARHGAAAGDAVRWEAAAAALRDRVLQACVDGNGALTLHDGGGGADAALSLVPLVGFLAPGDPRVLATLDIITERLVRGGLVDRYEGTQDGIDEACAPFLFATFWLAAALERCGRDGTVPFAAAAAARGDLDLMGEVADPAGGTPLGNLPQVQSHAALVLAATARPVAGRRTG